MRSEEMKNGAQIKHIEKEQLTQNKTNFSYGFEVELLRHRAAFVVASQQVDFARVVDLVGVQQ
jgi:hypothetical protein